MVGVLEVGHRRHQAEVTGTAVALGKPGGRLQQEGVAGFELNVANVATERMPVAVHGHHAGLVGAPNVGIGHRFPDQCRAAGYDRLHELASERSLSGRSVAAIARHEAAHLLQVHNRVDGTGERQAVSRSKACLGTGSRYD